MEESSGAIGEEDNNDDMDEIVLLDNAVNMLLISDTGLLDWAVDVKLDIVDDFKLVDVGSTAGTLTDSRMLDVLDKTGTLTDSGLLDTVVGDSVGKLVDPTVVNESDDTVDDCTVEVEEPTVVGALDGSVNENDNIELYVVVADNPVVAGNDDAPEAVVWVSEDGSAVLDSTHPAIFVLLKEGTHSDSTSTSSI